MRIVQEDAVPPVGLVDPIQPELSDLLMWMLEKDPEARPRSASQVLGELDLLGFGDVDKKQKQKVAKRSPSLPAPTRSRASEADTGAFERPPVAKSARPASAPPPPPSSSSAEAPPTLPAQPAIRPRSGLPREEPGARPSPAPLPRDRKSVLGTVGSAFSRWFGKKEEAPPEPPPAAPPEPAPGDDVDLELEPELEGAGETVMLQAALFEAARSEPFEEATHTGSPALDESTLTTASPIPGAVTSPDLDALEDFDVEATNTSVAPGTPTAEARTEPSWNVTDSSGGAALPRRAPEPLETQLERAGFEAIGWRGQTPEGMMSYDAVFAGEPVVVHVGRREPAHYDAKARAEALRWLIAEKPALFVPFFSELPLGPDYTAFVRRVPTPERLQDGLTLPPQAALAVVTVTFRALSWLHSIGRRFDDFSHNRVRAETASPERFACALDVPVEYVDDDDAVYTTAAGGLIRGDPGYFSPGMVKGRNAQHDAGYRAGALLSALLTGHPPFGHDHQALLGILFRRVSEDPPPTRRYAPAVDEQLARFVDAMVARDPVFRARPPAEIEAEMLAMLDPDWRRAVERQLTGAPAPVHIPEVEGKPLGTPREPTLSPGDRISLWRVETHLHFGGEAELYRVINSSGQLGVMKLWYDDRVDPYGAAWREFRVGITACAASPAFAGVLDAEVLVRGAARPYVVFEEVDAPTWMEQIQAGPLVDPARLVELGRALVDGIGTVHRYFGVLGDLSGRNVLFVEGRGPVLLDVASPGVVRSAVSGFGTAGYAAPEVADGRAPEPASDSVRRRGPPRRAGPGSPALPAAGRGDADPGGRLRQRDRYGARRDPRARRARAGAGAPLAARRRSAGEAEERRGGAPRPRRGTSTLRGPTRRRAPHPERHAGRSRAQAAEADRTILTRVPDRAREDREDAARLHARRVDRQDAGRGGDGGLSLFH